MTGLVAGPGLTDPSLERPAVSRDTEFYWDGLRAGELRIQRCVACGVLRHPPRPACPSCRALGWDWVVSAGRGAIFSYTVVHHPPVPGRSMPHPVALVELDEGVRVIAPLRDVPAGGPVIGAPVIAVFVDEGDHASLSVRMES